MKKQTSITLDEIEEVEVPDQWEVEQAFIEDQIEENTPEGKPSSGEIREYGKWIRKNSQTADYKEVRDKLREWIIEYYKLDKDTDYVFKRLGHKQMHIGINGLAGAFFLIYQKTVGIY